MTRELDNTSHKDEITGTYFETFNRHAEEYKSTANTQRKYLRIVDNNSNSDDTYAISKDHDDYDRPLLIKKLRELGVGADAAGKENPLAISADTIKWLTKEGVCLATLENAEIASKKLAKEQKDARDAQEAERSYNLGCYDLSVKIEPLWRLFAKKENSVVIAPARKKDGGCGFNVLKCAAGTQKVDPLPFVRYSTFMTHDELVCFLNKLNKTRHYDIKGTDKLLASLNAKSAESHTSIVFEDEQVGPRFIIYQKDKEVPASVSTKDCGREEKENSFPLRQGSFGDEVLTTRQQQENEPLLLNKQQTR